MERASRADEQAEVRLLEDVVGTWRRFRPTGPAPRFLGQPIDTHWLVPPDRALVIAGTIFICPLDRYGTASKLARWVKPSPGYTRMTRGAIEAARCKRRHA